ncbi:hypothetical protein DLM78_21310 [Leptospira stimsonii]|uniref:Uncharacterized protein n=1 Tax=Leptospira stimsonii TaxID=2202203 RepID=A0A8B3CKM2_9LEPT|nr:hypothetical protein DLM78_21310 [Leptospira stimsonii]
MFLSRHDLRIFEVQDTRMTLSNIQIGYWQRFIYRLSQTVFDSSSETGRRSCFLSVSLKEYGFQIQS